MKKSFGISLFLSAIIAAHFIACSDSSSEPDSPDTPEVSEPEDTPDAPSSAQCKELYGITEKNSWSKTITNSTILNKEACSKAAEFISQTGNLDISCYEAMLNPEENRIDFILNSEYGYRGVWIKLNGCKYKLGSDGDFNTLIPKATEWEFDGCLCKVEKGVTYYRNIAPKKTEESSSSKEEEISSSSEAFYSWQSSSSISYVPPLEAVAGTMIDKRDNREYKTVTIGTQTWMAENLAYAYVEPTKTQDSSSFCDDKDPDYCEKYGRLYLWSAAMDSAAVFSEDGKGCGYDFRKCANENNSNGKIRGICPEGWHLPNVDEYEVLFTAIGGQKEPSFPDWNNVEKSLKSIEGWKEYEGRDGNGFDDYGFNVMPVGRADDTENVHLYDQGGVAFFWTSDNRNDFTAEIITFHNWTPEVSNSGTGMNSYLSIRCLKD